tara:strand:- start:24 stop:302 length:279 start_codon:yes stop_codon:yes gene_type:complete
MLFNVFALDKPDGLELRVKCREEHVNYVKSFGESIVHAGPMTSDNGETPIGTLIILEAENRKEVESFVDNDPYEKNGLFASVSIYAWKKTIG